MTLKQYLKQFKNIAWYASAGKDFCSMMCLSRRHLMDLGIPKDDTPDCFIFTDYYTNSDFEPGNRFFLDLQEWESEAKVGPDDRVKVNIYNVQELTKLNIGFNQDLVHSEADKYYGRVFVADVLLDSPKLGKTVTKLIYAVAENTAFAFDFLLPNHIEIKYMIHNAYGFGFGGARSTGGFMLQIAKDLNTKYIACDFNKDYVGIDSADSYLSEEQRTTYSVLKFIENFKYYDWMGYGDTQLFEVVGFSQGNAEYPNGRHYYDYEMGD